MLNSLQKHGEYVIFIYIFHHNHDDYKMFRLNIVLIYITLIILGSHNPAPAQSLPKLNISGNKRFLCTENGEPFFWLGDTGWYLFNRLNREEAAVYLDDRASKGFNVIQCMVIPYLPLLNIFGDTAFLNNSISEPVVTPGNLAEDTVAYDYWDHVEYIVDQAASRQIYIALVPIWGTVAKRSEITKEQLKVYITWLVKRFGNKSNIIWLNGGDIKGSIVTEKWETIGTTIRALDSTHLITFHPFGRTQSSTWFHDASWLDFNMFQSGHRRYDQKKGDGDNNPIGEDNWKYVLDDYSKQPPKPTLDAEPSYENIPQGLHDTTQPYWKARDCRRYAYWSVFAGAFGHTYGDNSIIQFYKPGKFGKPAYGAKHPWDIALHDSGSYQMQHLKKLILARPYFDRQFDSSLVLDQGYRYDYVSVTRGKDYLFAYTYTGRPFTLKLGILTGKKLKVKWYDPRTGTGTQSADIPNSGSTLFTPPGNKMDGNDWVLILDDASKSFPEI